MVKPRLFNIRFDNPFRTYICTQRVSGEVYIENDDNFDIDGMNFISRFQYFKIKNTSGLPRIKAQGWCGGGGDIVWKPIFYNQSQFQGVVIVLLGMGRIEWSVKTDTKVSSKEFRWTINVDKSQF